ncbi:MAG: heme biosynthesis HemY N-terminal domain-containing protein [Coxiellaceae bacterium]|nr:heme biosynthesis HemY N-terminal domain-containing protein [Coxiellaceae bacterium]
MKALIITLIILGIGIWLGILMHHDSGYVLIAYNHWSLETSIWVAIVTVLITVVVLYLLVKLINGLLNLSGRYRRWCGNYRTSKSQRLTQSGLCLLAEGNWKKAEDALTKAAVNQPAPLINYLASARAAQELQSFQKRDEYLKIAYDTSKDEEMAIGLTQAQLQISAKQWEQALATLRHLQQIKPNHSYVLKLLQVVYAKVEDWDSLQTLLPQLKKQKVLSVQKYNALEKRVALARLQQFSTSDSDYEKLQPLWKSINKNLYHDFDVLKVYLNQLIELGQDKIAHTMIDNALKRSWNSELLEFIPRLQSVDNEKLLQQCEQYYKNHPKNANLLYCLGRVCERLQLWGKAKDYLEDCIKQHPQARAYLSLGRVYEALGDQSKALYSYKHGLQL